MIPCLSSLKRTNASLNSSKPKVSRTRKFVMLSPGWRLNWKYWDMIAAAFGKDLRTRGD